MYAFKPIGIVSAFQFLKRRYHMSKAWLILKRSLVKENILQSEIHSVPFMQIDTSF